MNRLGLHATMVSRFGAGPRWPVRSILEPSTTSAHETDNFSLPLDAELADLGPFLRQCILLPLQETVAEVNARIEKVILIKDSASRVARLNAFMTRWPCQTGSSRGLVIPCSRIPRVERALRGAWARQAYAGQKPSHQDIWMNFSAHFPLDLRRWTVPTQARTIKAYGVYFGTDKLVHFHHLGADYYRMYRVFGSIRVEQRGRLWQSDRALSPKLEFSASKPCLASLTTGDLF